ncbi:MAG: hypothetical protein U1E05_17760 [Patescibacteria group bacterium]|nr:hypothetical protein [Patescibacteria group bacterium]
MACAFAGAGGIEALTLKCQRQFQSLIIAFILGHIIAWGANRNWYHQLLYRWRITDRTSWVSEWHSAFSSGDTYIIIHISSDDEQRRQLLGWPFQYPDDPEKGHFVMVDAEWLIPTDNGYKRLQLTMDEKVVVPASSVTMEREKRDSHQDWRDWEIQVEYLAASTAAVHAPEEWCSTS